MSETIDLGPAFSPEENAFFESGGESSIPETGSDTSGSDTGGDAGRTEPEKPLVADKDGKGGDKVEKMVSLSALHEERTKRQERDAEIRKISLENAELKGKFSIIERLNLPAKEAEAPKLPPNVDDDIFGAVRHVGETVAQMQARLDAADKAKADEATATTERTTFVNNYKADAAKFEATKPDYRKAYDFILASRAAELKAIGFDTPEAVHNALTADEFAIAEMAFSKGKSPAEMFYNLAVQRGYKPADAAAAAADAGTGKGAEILDNIARGQALNKSLNDAGGSGGDGGAMTAAQLIAMPMAEFEEWTAKNPAKAKRLMGG